MLKKQVKLTLKISRFILQTILFTWPQNHQIVHPLNRQSHDLIPNTSPSQMELIDAL